MADYAFKKEINTESTFTSEAVTRGLRVKVVSRYSPTHSQPQFKRWLFLYTIQITNESSKVVRLISRHWIIEDGDGKREEVRGPGVVGEQPVLSPGQTFEYTSGCPLTTPFGSMRGTYQMVTDDGEMFDAEIAPFTLSEPTPVH
jgi:ApaG protein